MLDRELKKGSAELLILSLVEDQPRHGYDLSKLIEARSGGVLKFRVASLYPLLYRLEKRGWIQGRWIEKAGPAPPPLLPPDAGGRARARGAARHVARIRRGHQPYCGSRTCLSGRAASTRKSASTSTTSTARCARGGVPHDEAMRALAGEVEEAASLRAPAGRRAGRRRAVRAAIAAQESRLHRRRHAHARARYRRDHRDLHRRRRRAAAAVSLSGHRAHRHDPARDDAQRSDDLGGVAELPGLARRRTRCSSRSASTAPTVLNLTGGDQPERAHRQPRIVRRLQGASAFSRRSAARSRQTKTRPARLASRSSASASGARSFARDPAAIGDAIVLDGERTPIVGVMPAGMRFPSRLTDVWLPLGLFVPTLPPARGAHPGLTVDREAEARYHASRARPPTWTRSRAVSSSSTRCRTPITRCRCSPTTNRSSRTSVRRC